MTSVSDRVLRWAPFALLVATLWWVVTQAWGPLKDPDSWWHLRLGEDFLDQHSFATPSHWSSFATASWAPTQPLPEVVAALVNRALGLEGLVWMYVATLVILVLGVFILNRSYASPLPAVVATMLFVASGEGAMTPRPQLVSYILLAVVIATWLRTEQDLRPRWWLIPLSWLWSLCHGFWFIGVGYGVLAIVAISIAHRLSPAQLLRLALIPLMSALVVLLNPVGWRVFVAPFVVSARGQYIAEWQRADLLSGPTLTVIAMVAICVAVWVWRREDVTWFKVLVAASALVLSWYAVRTVVLGGLVMSPLLASALQAMLSASEKTVATPGASSPGRERVWLGAGAGALLAIVALVVPHSASRPGGVPLAFDPTLDRLPAGTTVFNDFTLGGWLSWRHPGLNRWVDGLADAYPVSHLQDTVSVTFQEPGWRGLLARSGATVAILEQGSSAEEAFEHDGWQRTAEDNGWVLLRLRGRSG
jgi:hypothetical protein